MTINAWKENIHTKGQTVNKLFFCGLAIASRKSYVYAAFLIVKAINIFSFNMPKTVACRMSLCYNGTTEYLM